MRVASPGVSSVILKLPSTFPLCAASHASSSGGEPAANQKGRCANRLVIGGHSLRSRGSITRDAWAAGGRDLESNEQTETSRTLFLLCTDGYFYNDAHRSQLQAPRPRESPASQPNALNDHSPPLSLPRCRGTCRDTISSPG